MCNTKKMNIQSLKESLAGLTMDDLQTLMSAVENNMKSKQEERREEVIAQVKVLCDSINVDFEIRPRN